MQTLSIHDVKGISINRRHIATPEGHSFHCVEIMVTNSDSDQTEVILFTGEDKIKIQEES